MTDDTATRTDVFGTTRTLAAWEDADTAYYRAIYRNAGAELIRALDTARKAAMSAYYQALARAMDATT